MIFDKISFPLKKLLQETTTQQKISQETNFTAAANSVRTDENDSGTSIQGTPSGSKKLSLNRVSLFQAAR